MSEALYCPVVGRDPANANALQFYFSRPPTDDEMTHLHDVMRRAVACMPPTRDLRVIPAGHDGKPKGGGTGR